MASLLDTLFPPQPSQVAGLLGVDEERMRQAAQRAGLLSTGLGIIAASGPSRLPQGMLQPVASGLMAGQQAYQGAINQQIQDAMAARRAQQEETIILPEGGTLVGRGTGRVVAQGAPRTPAKIAEFNAAKEQNLIPADMSFAQYQQMDKPPAPSINLSVNTERTYGGAVASKIADQDAARYDIATKAPGVLDQVQRTRQLLESGNVFTGTLANQKLELAKFGQAVGVTGKNTDEVVANTQMLMAGRAQATLDAVRASGLGAGQGFTDKDRQFLENARLGNITYSKKALEQQLEIEEKVARGAVSSWNNRLDQIPKSAKEPIGLEKVTLPEPQRRQQKGQVKFLGFE